MDKRLVLSSTILYRALRMIRSRATALRFSSQNKKNILVSIQKKGRTEKVYLPQCSV